MAATGCLAVSLLLLTMQVVRWLQTGKWEATTLGSLTRLQHAQISFDSAIVDRVAHWFVFDCELWIVGLAVTWVAANIGAMLETKGT